MELLLTRMILYYLSMQLNRRDEELNQLYEKVRIQQSTLEKGRIQYLDRLNELRALKIQLNDLKREQAILKGSLNNMGILKREIHGLGRELVKEQLKVSETQSASSWNCSVP